MFNRYQDKKFHGSYHTQDSTANDKVVKNHQRDFIEKELHKIFKLRIGTCRRTETGQLQCVSEIKDTELIKESQGTEELKAIDKTKIIPEQPCECGEEKIIVPLNDYSEKAGFIVKINGIPLALHEFIGGNKLTIEIKPPPKTPDTTEFHLFTGKINVLDAIMQNLDPYQNPVFDPLLDATIKYADHTDNDCHHCTPNKKRKRKNKE